VGCLQHCDSAELRVHAQQLVLCTGHLGLMTAMASCVRARVAHYLIPCAPPQYAEAAGLPCCGCHKVLTAAAGPCDEVSE
jgi:hypothetical protein